MAQKITVKIVNANFNLSAANPEMEELYRRAAEIINQRFSVYTNTNPGKNVVEILSMVALNETVNRLGVQRELERREEQENSLRLDLDRYLKDIPVK